MVFVLILGITGCGSKKDEAAKTGPSKEVKPIVLTYSSYAPEKGNAEQSHLWFMDQVEKRTNGRVTFKKHFNGTLTNAMETLPSLRTGAVDLATPAPTFYPDEFPIASMFNGTRIVKDWEPAIKAIYKMYFNDGEITEILRKEAEKQNIKILAWDPMQYTFFTSNKKVEKLDDLKGLRMRAAGTWDAAFLKKLGIIPVNVGPAEVYDSLSRGMIDGMPMSTDWIIILRLHEVLKHASFVDGSIGTRVLAINLDTWNKLPPDVKKVMEDLIPETHRFGIDNLKKMLQNDKEVLTKAGVKFADVDPKDQKRIEQIWLEVVKEVWLPKMKQKGIEKEATKVLDHYLELAKVK